VFRCERYAIGPRCPGPVADTEFLNLIISDPQTVDPRSGRLFPVLVTQVDGNGMSVLRDQATDAEFDITYAEMKQASDARGKPRFFHGVCRFLAGDVRYEAGERYLGVYATALPRRRHHADILAPPPPAMTRKEQEARKKRIIDKIGSRLLSVSDFRNGAFAPYAKNPGGDGSA
jgi:hypothetical protein